MERVEAAAVAAVVAAVEKQMRAADMAMSLAAVGERGAPVGAAPRVGRIHAGQATRVNG